MTWILTAIKAIAEKILRGSDLVFCFMSDMYCEISYYVLFQKQAEIKTQKPVLKNDVFTESRIPTRNEMLLKMSEEKRLEKLQKERAKLLEATLMRPEEMVKLIIYT